MTPFALGFMLISMISVTTLVVYCYGRILRDDKKAAGSESADHGA